MGQGPALQQMHLPQTTLVNGVLVMKVAPSPDFYRDLHKFGAPGDSHSCLGFGEACIRPSVELSRQSQASFELCRCPVQTLPQLLDVPPQQGALLDLEPKPACMQQHLHLQVNC